MPVSKSLQKFNTQTNRLLREATADGKNITKAQVQDALKTLTADGKISRNDREAAQALLERAPLTQGAKEALQNFVSAKPPTGGTSVLNLRLGGGEGRVRGGDGGGSRRTGGGEGNAEVRRRLDRLTTGGGESNEVRDRLNDIFRGGGGGGWGRSWGGGSFGGGE